MNIAQIIRLALFNADAVNLDGTTHRQITQPECIAWANEGRAKLEKHLRNINEDYLAIVLQSDDTDFRFRKETFDVSTLKYDGTATASQVYKRLPPDCVKIKRIRPITTGQEHITFTHMDSADPYFRDLQTSSNPQRVDVYWDIMGEGTLVAANPPNVATDIELTYIARSLPLHIYGTGTVDLTKGAATVTGNSTLWEDNEVLYWAQNADLITSTTKTEVPTIIGTTTANILWVDPEAEYLPINAITSDTSATLLGNYLQTSIATCTYMIASSTNLRIEDNWALVDWVTFRIAAKIGHSTKALMAQSSFREHVGEMIGDAQRRQIANYEFADDYEAD